MKLHPRVLLGLICICYLVSASWNAEGVSVVTPESMLDAVDGPRMEADNTGDSGRVTASRTQRFGEQQEVSE